MVRKSTREIQINTAVAENCDLILMRTHGRTGLDRFLFGSVAEKVVHKSTIPVLTLRPEGGQGSDKA